MRFAARYGPSKREPPTVPRVDRVRCHDRAVVAGGGVVIAGFPSDGHHRPRDRPLDRLSRPASHVGSRQAVDITCSRSLAFYRELLERERDWHRRLPYGSCSPAALSQAVIALTFYSVRRFAHTAVFFAMLAWLVGGGGAVTDLWVEAESARSRPLAA